MAYNAFVLDIIHIEIAPRLRLGKGENSGTWQNLKHYLRHQNKANKKQGLIIWREVQIYANTYAQKELKTMTKGVFHYVKVTNQLDNVQETSGLSTAPNTTMAIICKTVTPL